MDEFDDLKLSDSDDDEGAGERVRMIMEEIYKNQDKIKSEKDIEEMAERCTNMMTQMRNEAYLKKKEKKGPRSSGAGDKASPPPSRLSSVKESTRKDSTKTSANSLFPPQAKSSLKPPMDFKKKSQKPNFSDLYKEKMDKMRVPGKMDLKGSQTKTDSTKATGSYRSEEPLLWGATKRRSSTVLNEAHFKDALDRMKENGVRIGGKEEEPSVTRLIKTITEEESSDDSDSLSDFDPYSKDSDDESDRELLDEEKWAAQKLLKDLEQKKEQPYGSRSISELGKPYLSWLENEKRNLKMDGSSKPQDKVTRTHKKKKEKELAETLDVFTALSDPSEGSTIETSEVESDPEDPFSMTKEGKEIMRQMKKINTRESNKERRLRKKKEQSGSRPLLDSVTRKPVEWCTLAQAQAESRNQKEWIGEVKDIDSLWFKDVCEASERARKSGADDD